jgi:hypothetical protein
MLVTSEVAALAEKGIEGCRTQQERQRRHRVRLQTAIMNEKPFLLS